MSDVDTDFDPSDLNFSFDLDDAKLVKGNYLFKVQKAAFYSSQKDPNKPVFKAIQVFASVKEGPFAGFPARLFIPIPQKDSDYYRMQLNGFNRFASACAGEELDGPMELNFVQSVENEKEYVLPAFEDAEFWASVNVTPEGYIDWGKGFSGLLLHDPEKNGESAPF